MNDAIASLVVQRDSYRSKLLRAARRHAAVLTLCDAADKSGRTTVLVEDIRKALA